MPTLHPVAARLARLATLLLLAGSSAAHAQPTPVTTDSIWYLTNRVANGDAWERAIGPWRAGVRTFQLSPLRADRVTFELRLDIEAVGHDTMAPEAVLDALVAQLATSSDAALVLHIHGYATSWDRATREAAEMKQRGGYRGPLLVFSWPAHLDVLTWPQPEQLLSKAYWDDTEMVRVIAPDVARALRTVVDRVGASRLVVSSHSMGGQLLAAALADSALRRELATTPLRALVFASPDIDRARFRMEVLPLARSLASRVVLYATDDDRLLKLSARVHDGAPRAGLLVHDQRWPDALDVVDISGGRTASTWAGPFVDSNHAFRREATALVDLFQVVVAGLPAECRATLGIGEQQPFGEWRLTDAPLPPRAWMSDVQRADASPLRCPPDAATAPEQ